MYIEGKARIRYTANAFLNPEAKLSRDLSVAFLNSVAGKGAKALDATAATGIRGIRYRLEAGVKDMALLEINRNAFSSLRKNLAFNKVKASAYNKSIQEFANTSGDRFDIIDLDPFGGVTPYIYDLMKLSKGGGTYLLATATDTAVLCGAEYRACIRLYDAVPMHNELCHEAGVRILIGYIARVAAQFNFGVEALLSLSYMHYMRVFLKLASGTEKANSSVSSIGYAYFCPKCHSRYCARGHIPETVCKACGARLNVSGKLWTGSLHSRAVAGSMKKYMADNVAEKRELKLMEAIEGEIDVPLYYSVPKLTKQLAIGSVSPDLVIDELRKGGFAASKTHMHDSCIKTDAGISDMEHVAMRLKKSA
jgi:tRNA (guanine26-N2/guanine27-N2)-dimethyltransferase